MESASFVPTASGSNAEPQQPEPMLAETIPSRHADDHDIHRMTPNLKPKPSILRVRASENQAITRTEDRLDDTNWTVWRHRLTLMLQICGVQGYVTGTVECPDPGQDPEGASNWDFNDTYAKVLIANNVATNEMVHLSQSRTARDSWLNLEAVHDAKSHQTTIGITRNLYRTSAEDGDNIAEHLNKLKRYWERINLMADDNFRISDNQFKVLISSSLPANWDTFTEGYVGRRRDVPETDPKKLMSSQQFIGVIKEEATRREARRAESSHQAISTTNPPIGKAKYCVICKRNNHNTRECRNRDKKPCSICKKRGHEEKDCWYRSEKGKRKRDEKQKQGSNKKQKTEASNVTNEEDEEDAMQIEEVTFMTEENRDVGITLSQGGQVDPNTYNNVPYNITANNEPVIFYDCQWLADSATTSQIQPLRRTSATSTKHL